MWIKSIFDFHHLVDIYYPPVSLLSTSTKKMVGMETVLEVRPVPNKDHCSCSSILSVHAEQNFLMIHTHKLCIWCGTGLVQFSFTAFRSDFNYYLYPRNWQCVPTKHSTSEICVFVWFVWLVPKFWKCSRLQSFATVADLGQNISMLPAFNAN